MNKIVADISMSLDGFIAGPNVSLEEPMGKGGERLHEWMFDLASWRAPHGLAGGRTDPDAEGLHQSLNATGAVVLGRRMFDLADGWGETPPFHKPVFVLTHRAQEPLVKEGDTTFTFVTDGIERAVAQARTAAGDRDVSIAGGARTIQQAIAAGLLDEIQIHLIPILLGDGIRLFDQLGAQHIELEPLGVIGSPAVTHLKYCLVT